VNVVVLRDGNRKSIATGRSECPDCKHELAWYDLIPVLSFLLLGGKCRYCKQSISVQYPIVEAVAGLLGLAAVTYGWILNGNWFLVAGLMVSFLFFLIFSLIDLRTMEVPLEYVVSAGLIGALTMIFTGQLSFVESFIGMLFGVASISFVLYGWRLMFGQDGMGVGDIWIAGAVGAVVGFPNILVALMVAVFSGAIIGILAISIQKKGLETALPFGPFLFFGLLSALLWGQALIDWYILFL
jgi:leader peptidase (prepilin peptidase)/N-methyltransferase